MSSSCGPSNLNKSVSNVINFNMEYRDKDDAWYSVVITHEGNTLRVKYDCVPEPADKVFYFEPKTLGVKRSVKSWIKLSSMQELRELEDRFRPVSIQLQDKECGLVTPGVIVCASEFYDNEDDDEEEKEDKMQEKEKELKYYDAVVDDVLPKEHGFVNGEEVCKCEFLIYWKHGPHAGDLVEKKVEHICLVQDSKDCDLALYSFLEQAAENIESASPMSSSSEIVIKLEGATSSPTSMQKLTSEPPFVKIFKRARRSVPSKGFVSETIKQDRDIGGSYLCYTVFVDNLEKDLSPAIIMDFINKQTGVTCEVCIFPSLSTETFARCSITLDCATNFDAVYKLLENPNHIIISSKGKPWVVVDKKTEHKIYELKFRSLMLPNQINNDSGTVDKLKIVYSGSEEYEKAEELKEFFKHYIHRKQEFEKKLAVNFLRKIVNPICIL
ncbi:hypothetical protein ACFE04_029478 [Oxalis oulophora]